MRVMMSTAVSNPIRPALKSQKFRTKICMKSRMDIGDRDKIIAAARFGRILGYEGRLIDSGPTQSPVELSRHIGQVYS